MNATQLILSLRNTSIKVESDEKIIINKALDVMKGICIDINEKGKTAYLKSKNANSGFIRPTTFFGILEFWEKKYQNKPKSQLKIEKAIEWWKERNGLIDGYLPGLKKIKNVDNPAKGCFQIDKKNTPSEVLNTIFDKKTLKVISYVQANDLAIYQGIRALLGVKKFDGIFASEGKTPFTVGDTLDNPILSLFHYIKVNNQEKAEIKKGDILFFIYLDQIVSSAMCIKENKKIERSKVLFFDLPGKEETLKKIKNHFFEVYQEILHNPPKKENLLKFHNETIAETIISRYFGLMEKKDNSEMSKKEFEEKDVASLRMIARLNFDKIKTLKNCSSIEKCQLFLLDWKSKIS